MTMTYSPKAGDKVDVGTEVELKITLASGDKFDAGETVTFYLAGSFSELDSNANYGGMIPTDANQREEALYGNGSIKVKVTDRTHVSLKVFVWPGPDGVEATWRAISSATKYDTHDVSNVLNPFTLGGDTNISDYESHPVGPTTDIPKPDAAANNFFTIDYQAQTDAGVAYTGHRWARFYLFDATSQGLTLQTANIGAWDAPDATANPIPITTHGDLFVRSDANSRFTFYLTAGQAKVNKKTLSGVYDPFLGSIGGEDISISGMLLFVNLEANLSWLNPAVIIGSGTTYQIPDNASTVPFKITQPTHGQKISPGDLLLFFNRSMNSRNLGFKEISDPNADLGYGFNPTFTPPVGNFYTDGTTENDVVYVVVSSANASVSTSSANTYKMKPKGELGGNNSPNPNGTGYFKLPQITQLGTNQGGQLTYDNDSGGLTVKLSWPGISGWVPPSPPANIGVSIQLWLNGWAAGQPNSPLQGDPISPTSKPQELTPDDVTNGYAQVPVPFSMIQGYGLGPEGQPGTLQVQGFVYDTSVRPPKLLGTSPAHTVAFTSSKVGMPPR